MHVVRVLVSNLKCMRTSLFIDVLPMVFKAEFLGALDAKMVQATKEWQWEQYKANLHVKIASQRICASHYKQKTANSYLKCGDLCKLQSGCRVFSFGPMGGCRISACNDGAASTREGSCSSTEVRVRWITTRKI